MPFWKKYAFSFDSTSSLTHLVHELIEKAELFLEDVTFKSN